MKTNQRTNRPVRESVILWMSLVPALLLSKFVYLHSIGDEQAWTHISPVSLAFRLPVLLVIAAFAGYLLSPLHTLATRTKLDSIVVGFLTGLGLVVAVAAESQANFPASYVLALMTPFAARMIGIPIRLPQRTISREKAPIAATACARCGHA